MAGEINEKCAVAAVVTENIDDPASHLTSNALFSMNHRGPEATGMVSQDDDGYVHSCKGEGMVRDVYHEEDLVRLSGRFAIGHNKYTTSATATPEERHLQPFEDQRIGFSFAHNGNLTVTDNLARYLEKHNIKASKYNDSEMMGLLISQYIRNGQDLPDAVELAYPQFKGAFSCVAMHDGVVVAFRDSKGIRPLAMGSFDGGLAVMSETCGLDTIGAKYDREVRPGELVIIDGQNVQSRQVADDNPHLDAFEFVYFARHDSMLYDQRVGVVRSRFGHELAMQHQPFGDNTSNVRVVPVPETSVPAAEQYARSLKLDHTSVALIKNRYIGRTFLMEDQKKRHQNLRLKHNIIPEFVEGRDIIFIDDSIVRINTAPRLVELAKGAGALSVSVLIASPPVRFPDFYGIDTPHQSELAAANMTIEQMRQRIGCKYLGFLSLSRMVHAIGRPADELNLSCFNGEYPIGIGPKNRSQIHTPVSMEFAD